MNRFYWLPVAADMLAVAGLLLVSFIPACNPALPGVFG